MEWATIFLNFWIGFHDRLAVQAMADRDQYESLSGDCFDHFGKDYAEDGGQCFQT